VSNPARPGDLPRGSSTALFDDFAPADRRLWPGRSGSVSGSDGLAAYAATAPLGEFESSDQRILKSRENRCVTIAPLA
jgi:hypothetical protein